MQRPGFSLARKPRAVLIQRRNLQLVQPEAWKTKSNQSQIHQSNGEITGRCSSEGWTWEFITYWGMQPCHQVKKPLKADTALPILLEPPKSGVLLFVTQSRCGLPVLLNSSIRLRSQELEAAKNFQQVFETPRWCVWDPWNMGAVLHLHVTQYPGSHFHHWIKCRFSDCESFRITKVIFYCEPEKESLHTPFPQDKTGTSRR